MAINSLSRCQFLALSAAVSATTLAACVAPSAPNQGAAAPATAPVTVVHWAYSTLPLDRTTLKSVPADKTENVVNYLL